MKFVGQRHRYFLRNIEASEYLELFIVSAVAAILIIRLYLELSGYPKLGGTSLHIAHMLWGGLLMLISIIILLYFLSRASQRFAAILGGIGFGTFIDEVGKFLTHDHNYFFQPAVAVMYVTFILVYLAVQIIQKRWEYSKREYLLNALRELEEVVLHDLDENEKNRALFYLRKSQSQEPVAHVLRTLLSECELVPPSQPHLFTRIKTSFINLYQKVASYRAFTIAIIAFFIVQLAVKIVYAFVFVLFKGLGWEPIGNITLLDQIAHTFDNLRVVEWLELSSSVLSGVFVLLGVILIPRSRLKAFQMFERSILISILITQVFVFYREEFGALIGFGLNLIILIFIRFLIEQEKISEQITE